MQAICQKCPRHALCTLCQLTPEAPDSHALSHSYILMLAFYSKTSGTSCTLWVILAFWNCAEICITEFWQRQRRQQSLQTHTAPTATSETGENTWQLTGGGRRAAVAAGIGYDDDEMTSFWQQAGRHLTSTARKLLKTPFNCQREALLCCADLNEMKKWDVKEIERSFQRIFS